MLRKSVFGLDISDNSIEAMLLRKAAFGRPKMVGYARTTIRSGIVTNGVIKKPEVLAEQIRKLLNSASPKAISTPYCVVSLPESQVFTTVFKLPAGLRRDEIRNTIPYKAEEVIPFKSTEIYFDFQTLTSQGSTQEVFYVAVPTEIVQQHLAMLGQAGLRPLAFDLESVSIARSVIANRSRKGATLLMDIGSRTTNMHIFDRNGIRQSRTIALAGNRFTASIAKQLGLKPEEAAKQKNKFGFNSKQADGKVLLILQKEFRKIVEAGRELIDFYQTETQRTVDGVRLVGGSSLLPAVDQYLADNLGLEALLADPLRRISDPKKLLKEKRKSLLYATVSGLALRGIGKNPVRDGINLLPARKRLPLKPEKGDRHNWMKVYLSLTIFVILVVGFGGLLFAKRGGLDFYHLVFPQSDFSTPEATNIDYALLDELRTADEAETEQPTEPIATSTDELIEDVPEPVVVRVQDVPGGRLNVREGPATTFPVVAQAIPGDEFSVLEEGEGWIQIDLGNNESGWVFDAYVDKLE
ncbi:MAG TPA: type IV pilus assembly protein PilM [Candidatus Saccharimonadales bacterium]